MPNRDDSQARRLLRDEEHGCCDEEESQQGQRPQGCVDGWREQFLKSDSDYKIASGKTKRTRITFDNASGWETKVKSWIDNAEKAHEKARCVSERLALFSFTVKRLEGKAAKTVAGIQILLCLVKKIFDDAQDVLRVNVSSENQKRLLYTLKHYIKCKPDLDEKQKQDALACIAPYEKHVTAGGAAQDELLKKFLEMLWQADQISGALGIPKDVEGRSEYGREDSDKEPKDLGLRWQIEDLHKRITGTSKAKETVDKCRCSCQEPDEKPIEVDPPCGKDILSPSKRLLPIKGACPPEKAQQEQQKGQAGSAYYCKLLELFANASSKLNEYRNALAAAQQESDAALARRNSLEAARKAAEEAKSTK